MKQFILFSLVNIFLVIIIFNSDVPALKYSAFAIMFLFLSYLFIKKEKYTIAYYLKKKFNLSFFNVQVPLYPLEKYLNEVLNKTHSVRINAYKTIKDKGVDKTVFASNERLQVSKEQLNDIMMYFAHTRLALKSGLQKFPNFSLDVKEGKEFVVTELSYDKKIFDVYFRRSNAFNFIFDFLDNRLIGKYDFVEISLFTDIEFFEN